MTDREFEEHRQFLVLFSDDPEYQKEIHIVFDDRLAGGMRLEEEFKKRAKDEAWEQVEKHEKRILAEAHKKAAAIIKGAKGEAQGIIDEAKGNAKNTLDTAQKTAQTIMDDVTKYLKASMRNLKKQLRDEQEWQYLKDVQAAQKELDAAFPTTKPDDEIHDAMTCPQTVEERQ